MSASIREILDPDDTLLQVDLVPWKTTSCFGLLREKMDIMVGDNPIGTCDLVTKRPPYPGNVVHFDGVEIDEDLRGQGLGLATYIAAIEIAHSRKLPFETQDWDQKPGAVRVWDRLANAGIATVVEPFYPHPHKEGRFLGKYVVPVPESTD